MFVPGPVVWSTSSDCLMPILENSEKEYITIRKEEEVFSFGILKSIAIVSVFDLSNITWGVMSSDQINANENFFFGVYLFGGLSETVCGFYL